MARHSLVLDDTFANNITRLSEPAQQAIGNVLSELQNDEFFLPSQNEQDLVEADHTNGIYAYRQLTAWDDWQLTWDFWYASWSETTVESVHVMLIQQPLVTQKILPKKST